jgi:hypothetical protein
MSWVVVGVAVLGVAVVALIVVIVVFAWQRGTGNELPAAERWTEERPIALSVLVAPSRLSAAEMLDRARSLQEAGGQWGAVFEQLNPQNDPDVQKLLVEIRGPHLFAPHLGLGVIENGCRKALADSPGADGLAALQAATRSAEPFVG